MFLKGVLDTICVKSIHTIFHRELYFVIKKAITIYIINLGHIVIIYQKTKSLQYLPQLNLPHCISNYKTESLQYLPQKNILH